MKSIETLVQDIYDVIDQGDHDVDRETVNAFGLRLGSIIADRLFARESFEPGLRMSSIGQPCERKLWYSVNDPDGGEPLPPSTRIKFLFGDILEELLLFLAEAAGHTVEGTQDEVSIAGIKGHRDAIIDGVLVDVKSASTYSYQKFESGKLEDDDAFGYITQLQSYLHASQDDPSLKVKDKAAFLVIDKTLGHICLDFHDYKHWPLEDIYEAKKITVDKDTPPPRGFDSEPEGKSGNRKLGVNCSYCDYKHTCWPGLRTFVYAHKPVHLVEVRREPKVPEAKANP